MPRVKKNMNEIGKIPTSEFILTLIPICLSALAIFAMAVGALLTFLFGNSPPLLITFIGLPVFVVTLAFAVTIRVKNNQVKRLRLLSTLGVISSSTVVLWMVLMLVQSFQPLP
jgi:hypothetical protein